MAPKPRYSPIGDYALIADCHSAALVSRAGSVDWCCMPRVDAASVLGRLIDHDRGGHFEIALASGREPGARRYLDGTLVLETLLDDDSGDGVLLDCMTMHEGGAQAPYRQLLRIVECRSGTLDIELRFA